MEFTKYTVAWSPTANRPGQHVGDHRLEAGIAGLRNLAADLLEELFRELLHPLDQDLFLRGEVVVHRGGRHLDRARDVLDGHLVDRDRGEQPHRAVDHDVTARRSVGRPAGGGGGVDACTR